MDAGIWVRRGRRNPQGWGGETASVCSAPEGGGEDDNDDSTRFTSVPAK